MRSSQEQSSSQGSSSNSSSPSDAAVTVRRRRPPPPRLAWPVVLASSGGDSTATTADLTAAKNEDMDDSNNNNNNHRTKKRPARRVTFHGPQKKKPSPLSQHLAVSAFPSNGNHPAPTTSAASGGGRSRSSPSLPPPAQQLWTERYAPPTSREVVVAPKKVRQITEWLLGYNNNNNNSNPSARLLVLVGPPGVGKSTLLECLAREHGFTILEWTESYAPSSNYSNNTMLLEHLKPLDSLQQFLQQVSSGWTDVTQSNHHHNIRSHHTNNNKKKKNPPFNSPQPWIVLDELPHLHSPEAQARASQLLARHLQTTRVPTCWIYSDGTLESSSTTTTCAPLLEQWIPAHLLDLDPKNDNRTTNSTTTTTPPPWIQIIHIHPPTKTRFCKAVQSIVTTEQRSSSSLLLPNPNLEELYARSRGDLRWAITTLQYERIGGGGGGTTLTEKIKPSRDTKLSSFHALGKLLYAKRQRPNTTTNLVAQPDPLEQHQHQQQRPPLEFDPDRVIMEQSDMELVHVLHFLNYHSPDFYTDLTELATGMELLSDAAWLLESGGSNNNFSSTSSHHHSLAAAVAGRAVAYSNRHPAVSRFRALTAPALYRVLRQRRDNQQRLQRRQWLQQQQQEQERSTTFMSLLLYATEVWPWERRLAGGGGGGGTGSGGLLASYFDNAAATTTQRWNNNDRNDEYDEYVLREQQEILQDDDIVEDSE